MGQIERQMEEEEQHLEHMLASGQIDQAEYRQEMRKLEREYREASLEAAQEAYDRELGRW